ncbi:MULTISPECIES: antifreeze protein [Marinovum]|uniref:antifreeze protein n=1 Tax=Marinovum TaxID=367771 RepID=UPI00237B3773|nr:antifreeze protein [Marinovum sp. PR37]MDD9744617.1 antifreeze protein [Marinovum sp. PR37]
MQTGLKQALDSWNACLAMGALAAQAQCVIAYRSLGMFGGWSVARDETTRMFTEKPAAFFEANLAAALALASGQRPEQVTLVWVAPLSDAVGDNRSRLAKRGPAGPGALFGNLA